MCTFSFSFPGVVRVFRRIKACGAGYALLWACPCEKPGKGEKDNDSDF